jgi:hypothetical protein
VEGFASALQELVANQSYREALQRAAWQDFPFTAARMANDADAIRARAIDIAAAS